MIFGVISAIQTVYNGVCYISDKIGQGCNAVETTVERAFNWKRNLQESQESDAFENKYNEYKARHELMKQKYVNVAETPGN